jgi:hypothetical protein
MNLFLANLHLQGLRSEIIMVPWWDMRHNALLLIVIQAMALGSAGWNGIHSAYHAAYHYACW